MPYHHELSYESGPDIMWFHGAEPVLRDLNLTEDEALKLLSTVHEDEFSSNFHMYFELSIATFAVIANTFLLFIMNKHKQQYKSLLFILRLAMCVDCYMALVTINCQPVVHVTYGYFSCYCANKFLPNNIYLKSFLMTLQGSAIMSTVIWLPIQFAYRYHFIAHGRSPSIHRQLLYFGVTFTAFISNTLGQNRMHKVNSSFRNISRLLFYVDGWQTSPNQDFMGGGIGELRVWFFGGFNGTITIICYGIVIWLELKILKKLADMQKDRSVKHHIEINRALTALALVPLVTAVIPIMIYMIGLFMAVDPGKFMINATFTLSLASILNPVTTIALIRPYRRTFLQWTRLHKILPSRILPKRSSLSTTRLSLGAARSTHCQSN